MVCRALSFKNCTFELVDGVMDVHMERVYDRAAELWEMLRMTLIEMIRRGELENPFGKEPDEMDEDVKKTLGPPKKVRGNGFGFLWRFFWGAHQRFFKDLCVAAKVPNRAAVGRLKRANGVAQAFRPKVKIQRQ